MVVTGGVGCQRNLLPLLQHIPEPAGQKNMQVVLVGGEKSLATFLCFLSAGRGLGAVCMWREEDNSLLKVSAPKADRIAPDQSEESEFRLAPDLKKERRRDVE